VFANHHRTSRSPRYNPNSGTDVAGEYTPVKGVPAAIAVNHGPALSYVFDTTEGRLLYAWQGGFLDMFPYWGDEQLGNRASYDYLPRLMGTLFYKAAGRHPVEVNGRSVSELGKPRFVGYDLVKKQPEFIVRFGAQTIRTRVEPLARELGLKLEITAEPAATLAYRTEEAGYHVKQEKTAKGGLNVTLTGGSLGSFSGFPRRVNITEASVAAGEQLAKNYGCIVCHSADGSPGYGPTWAGLFERERTLVDGTKVKVDDAYLKESITAPNAKIAEGFAPNFMPVYTMLKPVEIESMVLFIKSLKGPE
jgi:cytochrome c2